MTNFEKYSGTLKTTKFGLINGVPVECDKILNSFEHDPCERCRFYTWLSNDTPERCGELRMYWLQQEYIEPQIYIPEDTAIDTKVLVSSNGTNWYKRHYAGIKNGRHHVWNDGKTSWTCEPDEIIQWEYMKLYE